MSVKVVVGAGGTGAALAQLLAAAGHEVRLVTRSGGGPRHPGIRRVALDASNTDALAAVLAGATTLYNCAAPPYHLWRTQLPALAAGMLNAAIVAGTDYVMLGNLYGYGPVTGPITEALPLQPNSDKGELRARAWLQAKAAHDAGRVRVTEVRASDFIGRGALSVFTAMVAPKVLAGKTALFPADLDAPHSWTGTVDAARALAAIGDDERAWGRPWHVPTNAAVSPRQLATVLAECAGVGAPKLRRMPRWLLAAAGLGSKAVRELPEMQYQLQRPFVMDASETEGTFGLTPTPLAEILRDGLTRIPAGVEPARGGRS
ncbi:NAD-dependent epimerase/dehydratase family protein [Mycobacterium palustre]|uniref:NAD-dependent epimerase n=1 Tax=Mycobacterium palustre TaxID=153971 RepID=A0A1X1ZQ99_9MYCO|nr:NAD-dependent epimerase/dehydratase family protein [Mycobacterium palustre]MCV7101916.1 NAD-dependent epimerase/dehydratase family protein [Mycobacterium palustre]ORW25574.1 NAD-dependent epimerase [Mycobacterium palustre]